MPTPNHTELGDWRWRRVTLKPLPWARRVVFEGAYTLQARTGCNHKDPPCGIQPEPLAIQEENHKIWSERRYSARGCRADLQIPLRNQQRNESRCKTRRAVLWSFEAKKTTSASWGQAEEKKRHGPNIFRGDLRGTDHKNSKQYDH